VLTPFSEGKKCRVKAHKGLLEIEGTLVAKVNDALQIQSIDVWYDPMALFNEVTKNGAEVIFEENDSAPAQGAGRCPIAHM